jgi:Flp pilus assembly protein TadD
VLQAPAANVTAKAGREANVIVAGQVVLGGTVDSEAVAAEIALHLSKLMRPDAVFDDRVGAGEPLEQALDRQVDQYRDLLREGSAQTALKLFRKLLDTLPAGASPKIRFRVKANVGHCYIQIGNFVEAERWLLEAYELAPTEKNAIANKALAFILTDRFC